MVLTFKFDLLMKNFNLECYIVMVAAGERRCFPTFLITCLVDFNVMYFRMLTVMNTPFIHLVDCDDLSLIRIII